MRLPKDLLTGTMTKPRLFLCETDKKKICQLEPIEMSGSFKFNAYSELTFTVGRTYTNMITGETQVNPFYNKIEALRLVYLEGFGYFEIQDPEIVSDGIKEVKNVTAYSLEYSLSQKYLENFYVNTGERNDIGVDPNGKQTTITLYNMANPKFSLLHLVFEKVYGWSIKYVHPSLATMSRTFEISRSSVYDFIIQDICDKFNCIAIFETNGGINGKQNYISLYPEALITKHIGNGTRKEFNTYPVYQRVSSVTVNSYKTTAYKYNEETGTVIFDEPPKSGAIIEITDGSQTQWITDVYVTFDNLAQEVNVSYSAENIKTVLTVKGADDLEINEVNMGLPYIVDLSYYYTVDWMGQDLYDAYTEYIKKNDKYQKDYSDNAEEILKLQNDINFEKNRTSLGYGIDSSVGPNTVGTYYVISGGLYPNYTYKEVSLPDDYSANVVYYKINGVNVTEDKVHTLYSAIRKYFVSTHQQVEPEIKDIASRNETWDKLLDKLTDSFCFVPREFNALKSALTSTASVNAAESAVRTFLNVIWNELGQTPLEELFLAPYEAVKDANVSAGYSDKNSNYYWFYYPVTIMLDSLNSVIDNRKKEIIRLDNELSVLQKANDEIVKNTSIYNNFTHDQLVQLSHFLREDEYTDDNFEITSTSSIEEIMKLKQELLECGRIELSKLCEPKLEFSMDMANIYALPEFEPIIDQFQLGNLINVAIRDDYVKRARLLAVDINFNDFSDFSCEFGELTNLRTPSSIHADLLANALSAGKSVASNASYWNKGADLATSTDIKIQQGLLGAISGLYNSDQSVTIDNNGILLRRVNKDGSFSPYQAWLTSNTILLSSDGFREGSTPRTGLGEFKVDGNTFYGILAEAVLSGYIEGSTIVGGTINIGDGAFVVDKLGNVTMKASNKISGYATNEDTKELGANIQVNTDSISAEVARAKNAESDLSSRIDMNANEITLKVSSGDFGTLIEQNYDHVKIAWNNNSKYVSFEDGSINIYESDTHSNDTLLMKQSHNGVWYYKSGYRLGKIGTNKWATDESFMGLTFNIEPDSDYMAWAHRENQNDENSTVKFIYYANSKKKSAGLHFNCDTYTNGYLYLSDKNKVRVYSDNSVGYDGTFDFIDTKNDPYIRIGNSDRSFKIFNDSSFMIYNNVQTDIYSSVYMHNYELYDTAIAISSDIRLKTNIRDSRVNALDMISKIDMKEFDWIENGEHEDIGMIAQQVQTVAPELVDEDLNTGKLSIKTTKFIPYLIKAIQELYEANAVSTYNLKRSKFADEYSLEDKEAFVHSLAYFNKLPETTQKTEVVYEPIIIPANTKENKDEQ